MIAPDPQMQAFFRDVFGQVPWVIPSCRHVWLDPIDSQFENEVYCTKCKVVGDRDPVTGEVYYPAT